jgi:hypothetical protein
MRWRQFYLLLLCLLITSGGQVSFSETAPPRPLPEESEPSAKPLPEGYGELAEILSDRLYEAKNQLSENKTLTMNIAAARSAAITCRKIISDDAEFVALARLTESIVTEAADRMERLNALPLPPKMSHLMFNSFMDGLFGNVVGGYRRGLDAEGKQTALITEWDAIRALADRAIAANLMLPTIAKEYSATSCDSTKTISVDFDEAWGDAGAPSWLALRNLGKDLRDCTIVVEIVGSSGDVRSDVFFLREWPASSTRWARFDSTVFLGDRPYGKVMVTDVNRVDVTIHSPSFATSIRYKYDSTERDKDVAEICNRLTFKGEYQPFKEGMFWNTERGIAITMTGIDKLPPCRVDLVFQKGWDLKKFEWDIDSWKRDETRTFSTSAGQLTDDPARVHMRITFKNTGYVHGDTFPTGR